MPIQTPPPSAGIFGQTATYPPTLDGNGNLRLSWGEKCVEEEILSVARTQRGERPMQPDYGANIAVFDVLTLDAYKLSLEQQIAEKVPNCERAIVTTRLQEQGEVIVSIGYRVRGSATDRTLTYPIFLGPTP